MGTVLDHLFETVLDDPAQNNPDQLRRIALRFYTSRIQRFARDV